VAGDDDGPLGRRRDAVVYDLVVEGRSEEVVLEVHRYGSREEALAAERQLRDERRAEDWEDGSSV
jgi:hypothetical protein